MLENLLRRLWTLVTIKEDLRKAMRKVNDLVIELNAMQAMA